ncbi:MFS transporter [Pararhodonellum marinum]|uniref:MFS transporter n=1 Tax=Pararhodonellum marinum TaxID=2755358 RepID=UPI00188F6765|nr:MFS transporter [Pararhodonellum marinum]
MATEISSESHKILAISTLAYALTFAAWTMNGVLVTYLANQGIFEWDSIQTGWLIGLPVFTGALFRFPAGILTDKFGGKTMFIALMLISAVFFYSLSFATGFTSFALISLGCGLTGASFAIGVGYVSAFYPSNWQGRALGILGAGTGGAALTTLIAPYLLNVLTDEGLNPEGWRELPKIYAYVLLVTTALFAVFGKSKTVVKESKSLASILAPIKHGKVWRLGLYYFLVFGCYVALAQWLVPYFMNVYGVTLVMAGFLASAFSLPTALTRIVGGIMSDKHGAKKVVLFAFQATILLSALLMIPKMDIYTPGKGITSTVSGPVELVSETEIQVSGRSFSLRPQELAQERIDNPTGIAKYFPAKYSWNESVVEQGDNVGQKDLLARGVTLISFQADMWVFAAFAILLGAIWGAGMSGVFKYIPDYFPNEVGSVGGMVAFIGAMGGFICPILFGYLLKWTGLWSSSWFLILLLAIASLWILNNISYSYIPKESKEEV